MCWREGRKWVCLRRGFVHTRRMAQPIRVSGKVRLRDFNPRFCAGLEKEPTIMETDRLLERFGKLQDLFYANANRGLIIVLQGMDTSGKDGTARRLFEFVEPAGVATVEFKAPSALELAHDYLWRVHQAVPRFGRIGLFNRSHYEDVLVVRVMNLTPPEVWQRRYDQINDFERMLTDSGYTLLKFFLHISHEEQAERLQTRLDDPSKNWKFEPGDLAMRERWDDFMAAYEAVLNKTSTPWAPWHVVPADRKWFRDYAVAQTVVTTLEDMKLKWPKPKVDLRKFRVK